MGGAFIPLYQNVEGKLISDTMNIAVCSQTHTLLQGKRERAAEVGVELRFT